MEARQIQKAPIANQQRTLLIIGIIAVVAVVVAIVAILVSNNAVTPAAQVSYAEIPHTRLSDGGFVLGDPEAPVTVVEFADFACPHCQEYSATIGRFIQDYVATGKAKLEYRMFISGADPVNGTYTAQLAECAAEQKEGGFWEAHDILFELGRRGRFNATTARSLADRMSLDYSALLSCAQDAGQYNKDVQMGESLGIQSTPSIMVRLGDRQPQFINSGGRAWDRGPVPYELLQAVVESNQS